MPLVYIQLTERAYTLLNSSLDSVRVTRKGSRTSRFLPYDPGQSGSAVFSHRANHDVPIRNLGTLDKYLTNLFISYPPPHVTTPDSVPNHNQESPVTPNLTPNSILDTYSLENAMWYDKRPIDLKETDEYNTHPTWLFWHTLAPTQVHRANLSTSNLKHLYTLALAFRIPPVNFDPFDPALSTHGSTLASRASGVLEVIALGYLPHV